MADCVVGIDLSGISGGTLGRTALACVALETPLRVSDQWIVPRGTKGDLMLLDWVEERKPLVVAIDAPLSLPHSVTCEDPRCPRCVPGSAEYLMRDVDRLVHGMPIVMLAAIAFRGIYLARVLRRRGLEVIETYPKASYGSLGVIGNRPVNRAAALVARTGPFEWNRADDVDAVCAALAAIGHLSKSGLVVPGLDGVIEVVGVTTTSS